MFREEGDLGGGSQLHGLGLSLGLLDRIICHGGPVGPVHRSLKAVESPGAILLPVPRDITKPTQVCDVSRPSSLPSATLCLRNPDLLLAGCLPARYTVFWEYQLLVDPEGREKLVSLRPTQLLASSPLSPAFTVSSANADTASTLTLTDGTVKKYPKKITCGRLL